MTTQHHEFESLLGAYALGALDGDDRRTIEAHLSSCAACQTELAGLRRVATGLGLAVEEVPPPTLKARVLAHVTGASQQAPQGPVRDPATFVPRSARGRRATDHAVRQDHLSRTAPFRWLAAAAVVIAVASGVYAWKLRTQLTSLRDVLAQSSSQAQALTVELQSIRRDSVRLTKTLGVLGAPDLVQVVLRGQGDAAVATGRAFWSKSRGLIFSADHLPPLQPGRVYQLWLVTTMKPFHAESAGVLTRAADGTTTLTVSTPAALAPVALAVSVEPTGGSVAPTTSPVLIGDAKAQ